MSKALLLRGILYSVKYYNTKQRAEGKTDAELEAFEALLDKKLDVAIDEAIEASRNVIRENDN